MIQNLLNHRPRKRLEFKALYKLFHEFGISLIQ